MTSLERHDARKGSRLDDLSDRLGAFDADEFLVEAAAKKIHLQNHLIYPNHGLQQLPIQNPVLILLLGSLISEQYLRNPKLQF